MCVRTVTPIAWRGRPPAAPQGKSGAPRPPRWMLAAGAATQWRCESTRSGARTARQRERAGACAAPPAAAAAPARAQPAAAPGPAAECPQCPALQESAGLTWLPGMLPTGSCCITLQAFSDVDDMPATGCMYACCYGAYACLCTALDQQSGCGRACFFMAAMLRCCAVRRHISARKPARLGGPAESAEAPTSSCTAMAKDSAGDVPAEAPKSAFGASTRATYASAIAGMSMLLLARTASSSSDWKPCRAPH